MVRCKEYIFSNLIDFGLIVNFDYKRIKFTFIRNQFFVKLNKDKHYANPSKQGIYFLTLVI